METITIKLGNDTQQLEDMRQIKLSADSMAAAALSFAKDGAQGYDNFLQTRKDFEETVDGFFKNYKRCEFI
jgi:hypothetical protein